VYVVACMSYYIYIYRTKLIKDETDPTLLCAIEVQKIYGPKIIPREGIHPKAKVSATL
jgi:hypothetical protein